MNNSSGVTIVVVSILVVLCCCLCIAMLCLGGIAYGVISESSNIDPWSSGMESATPVVIRPSEQPQQSNSGNLEPLPDEPKVTDSPEVPNLQPKPTVS